jgi:hypothetical protein
VVLHATIKFGLFVGFYNDSLNGPVPVPPGFYLAASGEGRAALRS